MCGARTPSGSSRCSLLRGHSGSHFDRSRNVKWKNDTEPPKQLQPGDRLYPKPEEGAKEGEPLIINTPAKKNESFSEKMARQKADMEKRKEEHLTSEDLKDRRAVAQERGQTGKRVIKKNTDLTAKVNPNPFNQTDKKVDHKAHVIFGTSLPWGGQRHNDQKN